MRRIVLPCLEEGGLQMVSDPHFSHVVAPSLSIKNDPSLTRGATNGEGKLRGIRR